MKRREIGWAVLAVAAVVSVALASATGRDYVRVSIVQGRGNAQVLRGEFSVSATPSVIWATLSDYDHLPSFVSSVVRSRLLPGPVVEQTMVGTVGPFRKKIELQLALDESPQSRIDFQDFGHRSFSRYVGSWEIRPAARETTVVYSLEAVPRFFSPTFVTRSALKRSVTQLLTEVRAEVIRRSTN